MKLYDIVLALLNSQQINDDDKEKVVTLLLNRIDYEVTLKRIKKNLDEMVEYEDAEVT